MLEGLSIPHYAKRFSRRNALKGHGFSRAATGGLRDNVTGADNQQERSVASWLQSYERFWVGHGFSRAVKRQNLEGFSP
jgi:hypothetical protein